MDVNNLSVVRQSFANTVFTHKVQEVASEIQESKSLKVKIVNIVLVAFILIFLSLQLAFPQFMIYGFIGIVLSLLEIILLIFQLNFNFSAKAELHKRSALKYMELRDRYRSLISDIMTQTISKKETIARRDDLQTNYQVICDLAPQTGRKEYQEAQKRLNKRGIVDGEDFTWSDQEIDKFLPEKLRMSKK